MMPEAMRSERYLVVIKTSGGLLPSFSGKTWTAVEAIGNEAAARALFKSLRIPLEVMKVGAVLVRALTTLNCERIAFERVVVSKDAPFWELQSAEIVRANEAQQQEWDVIINRILKAVEVEKAAAAAQAARLAAEARERVAAPPPPRSGVRTSLRFAASIFLALTTGGLVVGMMRDGEAPMDAGLAQARDGTMTIIMQDPTDPRLLAEYALRPDGSRTLVRRIAREQPTPPVQLRPRPDSQAGEPRTPPKNLVDAVSGFFSYRQ